MAMKFIFLGQQDRSEGNIACACLMTWIQFLNPQVEQNLRLLKTVCLPPVSYAGLCTLAFTHMHDKHKHMSIIISIVK